MAVGKEALGRKHFKTETVRVDEWDGDVILRGLTSKEQEHIQELATKGVNAGNRTVTSSNAISSMARYAVVYGWVDEAGSNVLAKNDVSMLAEEPFAVIQNLSTVVLRLSGMDVPEDSTAVDEAEKN